MKLYIRATLFLLTLFASVSFANVEVLVRGLMKNSAVVEINGKQRMLKVGKASPEGVVLISATSKEAVIEIDGERHRMGITPHRGLKVVDKAPKQFRIPSGDNGHFYASGLINSRSAKFVVDTGASSVALSEVEARRLGLNYKHGQQVEVSTASGTDLGYQITLDTVTVGSIKIRKVEAIVLPGNFPQTILLGNSFLSRVNYQVSSGVFVLEAKF